MELKKDFVVYDHKRGTAGRFLRTLPKKRYLITLSDSNGNKIEKTGYIKNLEVIKGDEI